MIFLDHFCFNLFLIFRYIENKYLNNLFDILGLTLDCNNLENSNLLTEISEINDYINDPKKSSLFNLYYNYLKMV
jgi:hypothetical protein